MMINLWYLKGGYENIQIIRLKTLANMVSDIFVGIFLMNYA